jgi:hypothetical protein
MMPRKKVNFVWKAGNWTWEATKYEGNGIFFGKVTSPYVPEGEYGTWYLWQIEEQGAKLVRGNKVELDVIREKRKKDVMKLQKIMMR